MKIEKSDLTIIGGGVVGLSIALGLLQIGRHVTIIDGSDEDFRASHGNFGLVWLQGKGANFAPYANWTYKAVHAWSSFSTQLNEYSHSDVALSQTGGFEFFTDATELENFAEELERQQIHLGKSFNYEVIDGDKLRRHFPKIGQGVAGATYSELDGHVNPLRLLRALRTSVLRLGGKIKTDVSVTSIEPQVGGGFSISMRNGEKRGAERVILAAGLGNMSLAKQLGFVTQVRPQRGELLITEKLNDLLPFLSSTIRQVDEGGIQIGGTKQEVGLNDTETLGVMTRLAHHAVTVLPDLADVRVVRAWGALRVMTPDGFPVYARSSLHPGAFLVTCHSGITLAPLHAGILSDWIESTSNAPDLEAFDENRFALSNAA